jgi:transketolase
VGLLTYGGLVAQCDQARAILESRGVPVRLVNLRTLQPLDEPQVVETARATRLLVTVEDHFLTGGLYSMVAEILVRHGISRPLRALALRDKWFQPGLLADVLAAEGFSGEAIARRVFRECCGTALQEAAHAERR